MTPEQFAAALRGDQKPAAVKVCNFAGRVAGRLPVKPSQMRAVRHFLEAEDAPAPAWISKRNAADKKSPEDHLSAGIRKAMEAILDDDDLDWGQKLEKLKHYIMAHARLKDDDAETVAEWFVAKAGKRRRGRKGRRVLSEAQVGSGISLGRGQFELQEDVYQDGGGLTVDGNVVRNVRILGQTSKNGRRYTMESVRESLPQYEGLRVNLNHPAKPTDPRHFEDRFGKLESVRAVEGEGSRGNLRFNPEHPMARTFAWWAQNEPGLIGLSHNALGEGSTVNGVFVVSKIVKVRSVDVVSDAATNSGLV
jgi:hypothetical protein